MSTQQTKQTKQTGRTAKTTKSTRKSVKTITDDQRARAEKAGQFIKASGSGFLRLSGAPRFWEKNPHQVYNLGYRLTGTLDEIRDVLRESGLTNEDIEYTLTNETITRDNYNSTMKESFDNEIADADAAQKQKAAEQGTPEITLDDLDTILRETLKITQGAIGLGKTTRRTTRTTSPRATTARGPKTNLEERLKSLPKGYVLDVSAITQDGTGAKKMKEPTKGGKSKKVGIEGLAIVSNNYKGFDQAMKLLGRDYEKYSQQYANLYGTGSEAVIPTKATISPRGRTKTASPPPAKRTASPTTRAPLQRINRPAASPPPAKRTAASPPPPAKRTIASPITRAPLQRITRPAPKTTTQPTVQPTETPAAKTTTAPVTAAKTTAQPIRRVLGTGGISPRTRLPPLARTARGGGDETKALTLSNLLARERTSPRREQDEE